MSDETTREKLTPEQLAYVRKLWRHHKESTAGRAFKRAVVISGALTTAAIGLSAVAGFNEWSRAVVWLLGFAVGMFHTTCSLSLRSWRMRPVFDVVIDWKRVEEIATAETTGDRRLDGLRN